MANIYDRLHVTLEDQGYHLAFEEGGGDRPYYLHYVNPENRKSIVLRFDEAHPELISMVEEQIRREDA